jgi:hypothetical protein
MGNKRTVLGLPSFSDIFKSSDDMVIQSFKGHLHLGYIETDRDTELDNLTAPCPHCERGTETKILGSYQTLMKTQKKAHKRKRINKKYVKRYGHNFDMVQVATTKELGI